MSLFLLLSKAYIIYIRPEYINIISLVPKHRKSGKSVFYPYIY